jgi:hypothetical protein
VAAPEHPGQGKLRSTVSRMSEEEAVLLGQKLVAMLYDLAELGQEESG